MAAQPDALRRALDDPGPVARAAERLHDRRVFLVGTGTSWHAANQGAWLLRLAGMQAWPVMAADAVGGGPFPGPPDAMILLSHRGTKTCTTAALAKARDQHVSTVVISRVGNPDADIETVPNEKSSAFTVSHTCALFRLTQLAVELGAPLERLVDVPAAVEAELASGPIGVAVPSRLVEFAGMGINAWTAAEGALKTRETSYLACSGGNGEQILHGPSVALSSHDALICLDGGGSQANRLDDLADVASAHGAAVYKYSRTGLGEPLSIFTLTVIAQKIAAEAAETLRTDPDTFGKDLPGHAAAWDRVQL